MSAKRSFSLVGFTAFVICAIACGKAGENSVTGLNNQPPQISSMLVTPDGMVPWGGNVRVRVEAVDPDGDTSTLTFSWKASSGSKIGPNLREAVYEHNGVVRDSDIVTVTVLDQVGGSATQQVTLRIASTGSGRPTPTPGGPGAPGTGVGDTSTECVSISAPCLLINGSRSPYTGDPGERVTVTVPSGPGGRTDWIGLHRWPGEHEDRLEKQYLNGSSAPPTTGLTTATLTFQLPSTAGDYNFRFFSNDTFNLLSTSAVVTVRRPPTEQPQPTRTPPPNNPPPNPTDPPTPPPTPTPEPTATPTPTPRPTNTPTPVPPPGLGCPGNQSQSTGGGAWSGSAGVSVSGPATCSVNCTDTPSCSLSGCDSISWTSCNQGQAGGTNACFTVIEIMANGPGGSERCSFIVEAKY